jgi:hypothetical protein
MNTEGIGVAVESGIQARPINAGCRANEQKEIKVVVQFLATVDPEDSAFSPSVSATQDEGHQVVAQH